jgi:single-stranded DNA-binding protein
MSRTVYGQKTFHVSGTLEEVPRLETTKNGFEVARFVLNVVTRNTQKKEDVEERVQITTLNFDAKAITNTRNVRPGMFLTVTGSIRPGEYQDRNGETRHTIELVASKIMGF